MHSHRGNQSWFVCLTQLLVWKPTPQHPLEHFTVADSKCWGECGQGRACVSQAPGRTAASVCAEAHSALICPMMTQAPVISFSLRGAVKQTGMSREPRNGGEDKWPPGLGMQQLTVCRHLPSLLISCHFPCSWCPLNIFKWMGKYSGINSWSDMSLW